ncbi:restriction endonuclease subunit M [Chryseobacterium sp. Leaf404]|uniref:Eco57I restriction-modification methylase domain-containing protein n=1 Tax=unclassified Chryseobacterium TaxID=2593645 RepID=UPI0006F3B339|nr:MULTISPECIES: N-6 DNA methylase [unclassified Chryseobacterium]KQT22039.1 restriction endonuclease subunit M [Chryseobacterium sp. Leaf404]
MPLFQKTIINKYLKTQNARELQQQWEIFHAHFHNPVIQENIRSSKEEQYQGEFLIDLFVKVLGYTKNPTPDFNLTTEYKNIKDSKKADGAIVISGKTAGIIELKGTNTTDLAKIEDQAFGYKNNQKDCKYVITSNFEKLRFYIDNAIEHLEFNLFELIEEDFEVLYLCLAYQNIAADIPGKIKDESLSQEDVITKKLYKDYSLFKRELFQNLLVLNPEIDQLELFKKSQKLLDRFLFLFFGEDSGLLPPNSVRMILEQWDKLRDLDEYVPLYDRFRKYFMYLNTGFKGKQFDVFAYNGGLFKPDEILDTIQIDDQLLYTHTKKLAEYDFESEVDVNILGHIFENSLNEIDEIKAQLAGEVIDKSKTKRKKDGVFYTPKYITKYIVENTVGKLCTEKKAEIKIVDEEYFTDRKRQLKTKEALLLKLKTYRDWLLQITIIDPACGSGAFLNEALNFLMAEHKYLDELETKLLGGGFVFPNIENSILENNLFGVDLNEESVEIAKLSLWLRTAQPYRKLNDLNSNIKCGNSLIDDPEIAGDKAFNWQQEFPQVFAKGGFDVVIGNPPYLRVQGLRENYETLSFYYEKIYQSAVGRFDIYVLFIEKSFSLINTFGIVSFILPHNFLTSDFGKGIRKFLYENRALNSIVHFGSEIVFADASTYTCILTLTTVNDVVKFVNNSPKSIIDRLIFSDKDYIFLDTDKWNFNNNDSEIVLSKLNINRLKITDFFKGVYQGIVSGDNNAFYLYECRIIGNFIEGYNKILEERILIENNLVRPLANGKDINKYFFKDSHLSIIYPYELENGITKLISEENLSNNYPNCYSYFQQIRTRLVERGSKSMIYPNWYSLWNFRNIQNQKNKKILTPDVCYGSSMYLDFNGDYFHNDTSYALILKENYDALYKYFLAVLNSKLCWFYLKNTSSELRGGYFRFKTKYLEPFPLTEIPPTYKKFEEKADQMLSLNKELQEVNGKFQRNVKREFSIEKLSKKLESWYKFPFSDFLTELKKLKAELSLSQKADWEDYFIAEQQKAIALQSEITKTDAEIDQMVYALYGLTEEEIGIVENA